jgi:hypothetical protein
MSKIMDASFFIFALKYLKNLDFASKIKMALLIT